MKRTRISRVIGTVLLSALLLGAAATARAQKAAIVAAVDSSESGWVTAMTRKITDTGLYPGGVDYIPSAFGYPSLTQLSSYNLLVVFSSAYGLGNGPGLGRVLGDYRATLPAGGVLLFDPYTWQTGVPGAPSIGDRFLSDYALTTQSSTATASATKRGTVGLGLEGTGKAQFGLKTTLAPSPAAPLTLAGGASFTVEVRFKPQDQGTHLASLYVDLSTTSRTSVSLSGESKGSLYLVRAPVDFGGIATGATAGPVTVRILNTGSAPVDLDKPVLADTVHYELATPLPDAKVTLIKGASYSFTLKFTPGMTAGQFPTQVTVTSTDPSSPLSLPVLGMAGPPKLQISATSLVLPDVPLGSMGAPIDLTLANTGNSELKVTSIALSADDFTIPNAPTAMSPLTAAPLKLPSNS